MTMQREGKIRINSSPKKCFQTQNKAINLIRSYTELSVSGQIGRSAGEWGDISYFKF